MARGKPTKPSLKNELVQGEDKNDLENPAEFPDSLSFVCATCFLISLIEGIYTVLEN